MYAISKATHNKASAMGYLVRPSTRKGKKMDVFDKKTGKKVASIGQKGAMDYHMYVKSKTHGESYARERRRLYLIRHKHNNKMSGRLAKALLW